MKEPNTIKVQKNGIYQEETQGANFQDDPLYQATKQHLNR